MISKRSIRYCLEGFCTTGTEVEDAGYAIFQEPQIHIGHITHVDEVAFKVLATFEQFRRFTVVELGVEMESDARHAAFMAFTRPINVEIAEANNL